MLEDRTLLFLLCFRLNELLKRTGQSANANRAVSRREISNEVKKLIGISKASVRSPVRRINLLFDPTPVKRPVRETIYRKNVGIGGIKPLSKAIPLIAR